MSGHVFISYSRADRGYVERLAAHLELAGIDVWYDHELAAGDRFDTVIQKQIDTCAALAVVLTPSAVKSEWVGREIAYAQHRGKSPIPLLLQACDPPILLITTHREDVTGGRMPSDRFVANLSTLVGGALAGQPSTPLVSPKVAGTAGPAQPPDFAQLIATERAGDDSTTIEVVRLTKWFRATMALDAVSFTVRPGVVTGILGPSLAGKTTAIRLILGLERPDGGRATIGGRAYTELPSPALVGTLLDPNRLPSRRSAYDHLLKLARTQGLARPDVRAVEVLDLTGMRPAARRRFGSFSPGMKTRLGLSAAMLSNPSVLVLDEPCSNLDREGVRWLGEFLRELARRGRTVLVSSRYLVDIEYLADHVVLLASGRLVLDGTLGEARAMLHAALGD